MTNSPDTAILNSIIPRLIPTADPDAPILGLEIIDGPYTGVTYSYNKFLVQSEQVGTDGMVPTKFETTIHSAPRGFRPNEAFDAFCADVLLAWLHVISVSNLDTGEAIH